MSASRASSVAATQPGPPPAKKTRGIVASFVLLAAWAVVFFSVCPLPPRFDAGPHRALGQVLGEETLKLRDSSSRLIVITRDTEGFKTPASTAQLEGFQRALQKGGAKITATHVLKVDPLRVVGVPSGDFLELLRKSADNDVIVSFLGPPTLSGDQLAKLGNKRPHVLAVCSGAMPEQIDLPKLFEQKLLHVAVVSRPDTPRVASGSGGGQGGFDRMFKLITALNLAELAPRAEARP
jgi:hypothetical protein